MLDDSLNAKDIKQKLLEEIRVENVDMHIIYSLLFNCRRLAPTHIKNVYSIDRLADDDYGQCCDSLC